MELKQVQDLKEKGFSFGWKLLDDGAKASNFHESDWIILDYNGNILCVCPNRVVAEQLAFKLRGDTDG